MHRRITILVALILAAPGHGVAKTWNVDPHVAGYFHDIQPAVEAAAPGDTIRIGPGRYDQFHPIVAPAWTEETIVAVTKDNLTLIGAGPSQTVLGPTSFYGGASSDPKGICSVDGYAINISNLTIENVEQGIYWWQGALNVDHCVFRTFVSAVGCWIDSGNISDCQFEISNNGEALVAGLTNGLTVSRCSFVGYGQGFTTGASAHNINFYDCEFRDNRTAVVYDRGSTGTIQNTTIAGSTSAGLMVTYNSQVDLNGVRIQGGLYGLNVGSGSVVHGVNVVVEETSVAALSICCEAAVTLHNSHILPSGGTAVSTDGYDSSPRVLDLSGNYWGTTDSSVIAGLIVDSEDDASNHCTVAYIPYANGPVPAETTTWGDLKALFR